MENRVFAPSRDRNQSDSDVIRNASGSLALRGIFLCKDPQELSKERKIVLEIPENVSIVSPSKPSQDLVVKFESLREEQNFQQCLHRTGLNISGGISVSLLGFEVKHKTEYDSSQLSDMSLSSRAETEYASITKYSSVPMASCELNMRDLRLSPLALDSLKQLQNTLKYECSDERKHQGCADFLYSYGSHVNCGNIVFGGVFEMKAETSKFRKCEKGSTFQMLSDILRTSVSVTKVLKFDMSMAASSSSCNQVNRYSNEQLKNTTLSIHKVGGLPTASDLADWKKSLLSHPETWHVIDRGSIDELLPVWIILQNHINDLEDSELLAQSLRKCWEIETRLLNQHPEGCLVFSSKEMEKEIASIQIWNDQSQDTFLKNCERYVSECQGLRLSLRCPDVMWYEKFLCHPEVQRFIENATHCLDRCENKIYLTMMTSSLLEPVKLIQVSKFPGIAQILRKLRASEDSKEPWCMTLEDAVKSVKETKKNFNFLDVGPDDPEKNQQLCQHLYRTIDALQWNLKQKEKYADVLVTGILILPFNGSPENSKQSLTIKDLESLLYQMEKIESILKSLCNLNDTQRQAYLMCQSLKVFRESGWREKDCAIGMKILCNKLGKELSLEIKGAVFTEHDNVKQDLESLEEELLFLYNSEPPASTRKASEQKTELLQLLNSLDQEECVGSDRLSSKQTSDPTVAELLHQLGMDKYYPGKLSVRDVLDLGTDSVVGQFVSEPYSIIWNFIQKVLMANSTARKAAMPPGKAGNTETAQTEVEKSELLDIEELFKAEEGCKVNSFHPLDITIIALMCSDQVLQQELVSKMAMGQFAVPLLFPKRFGKEVLFHLWALRSIVKKWTPQSLIPSKGFVEDNLVAINMPTVSFVRLGSCKESKSRILNEILSDGQLSFFVNRHMEQGDLKREISDGLAEICWYLPSGDRALDTFSEAFSVINLRGDANQCSTQLSFLTDVSTATFIFINKIGEEEKEFITTHSTCLLKSKLFLVMNISQNDVPETSNNLKCLNELLQLKRDQFVQFGKSSSSTLKQLRERVAHEVIHSVKTKKKLFSIIEMAEVARKHGIFVDEDEDHLKRTKTTVEQMIEILETQSAIDFKKNHLHYQGEQWKTWSKVDKEQSRLKCREAEPTDEYTDRLEEEKKGLRKKQLGLKVSPFMTKFIEQIHSRNNSKMLFIQWLKLELDSRSRKNLKSLHIAYKDELFREEEKGLTLKRLDREISESSLGLEHLLREVGQIYEATTSDGALRDRRCYQQLPQYAAQLMLRGVPLELIDGDASNIPLQWITNVLEEMGNIVGKESKIFVVSVLGVQSTGKSTLLNTMFGLQFAVSSGRCTRGAFMQLLGVKGHLKEKLGCDFLMVIDTEGLKAQELAQLEDSYEHDNELATLVTGLSDLVLVNVSTENSTEMRDTLQIVVHAFIRMREVGKRPNCQFIHQNAGDITAHEKNVRDRMHFLDQLNEMTKAAARMEGREGQYSSFGDVMEYESSKSNWYIGSLWHGNPPMAAVSTGYCKNILDIKNHIFECLEKRQHRPGTVQNFSKWLKNIWAAVKKENFLFSFQNSLVAEAYNQLSLRYCDLEWELREFVMSWTQKSENKIKNNSQTTSSTLLAELTRDLNEKVAEKIARCIEKLKEYFCSGKENVHLVERYKAEFHLSLQSLGKELTNKAISQCSDTFTRQEGLQQLIHIQKGYQQQIETEVNNLLMYWKKQERELEENELEYAFECMWHQVTSTFPNSQSRRRNITLDMENALWSTQPASTHLIPENMNLIKEDHLSAFTVKPCHVQFTSFWKEKAPEKIQAQFADMSFAEQAQKLFVYNIKKIIDEKVIKNINYDQNFCLEILREIDFLLKNHDDDCVKFNDKFKTDFKLHVSGYAVKKFEEMQDRFHKENDPMEKLGRQKGAYLEIFKDTYCKRDQTHKKAKLFCERSLKPAVMDCVKSKLGASLLEDLRCNRRSLALSTSKFFHASLLLHLMEADDFCEYYRYMNHYEDYATERVQKCVLEHCEAQTDDGKTRLVSLATQILKQLSYTAMEGIKDIVTCTMSDKISDFIEAFAKKMDRELVIPTDDLDLIAFQSDGSIKDFASAALIGIKDLEETLGEDIGGWDVEKCISELPNKPSEELIKSLLNCKKQCPFCGVPCERAGLNHSDHYAEYHIPDGLAGYADMTSKKLSTDICTISVSSGETFRNEDTDYKTVAYKDYKSVSEHYRSWQIQSDSSYEATSYWKSVFYKFNQDFAMRYASKPADIPTGWNISKEQVRKDLEETYQVSLSSIA